MRQIYLDNAATTSLRQEVIQDMKQALEDCFGNPSSTHAFGRTAKTGIEQARKTIASELGAKPGEIIFTSGGTEADNMILRGAVRDLGVRTIITTKIEHHAVLHTAEALSIEAGVNLVFLPLDENGSPDLEHLEMVLKQDESKKLVSLMHVNNEIGNITDLERVGRLCYDSGALFHSDTVQSIGHYRLNLETIPIDFATAAAHKFHGPKGIGFAYIRKNSGLGPLISGGAQERGFRAGTEPYHNIMGMETAFKTAYSNLEQEHAQILDLKMYFVEKLKAALPEVQFNGYSANRENSTYTLLNVRLPMSSEQGQLLLFNLDLKGIACSKGSACQSGSAGGSHVLQEILSPQEAGKPSVRFSFSHQNTREEIDYTVAVLRDFVSNS
jgi:cysteine desulfurase